MLVGDGIVFKCKEVIDRVAAAGRIAGKLAATRPSPRDVGQSEDEFMPGADSENRE